MKHLQASIREYSLYQAVALLLEQLRVRHPQLDDEQLEDLLELRANPSLSFASSDIESLAWDDDAGAQSVCLELNVMGLVGATSPLPVFYSEQALGDEPGAVTTRDFLDVFNHRLLRLLRPIWRKYRYHARYTSGATDPFSQRLFALIGLGGERIRETGDINWKRLLPYLGLLSLRAHSAALIEAVLRYYFNHAHLFIEQCLERSVLISGNQRNRLGLANHRLGDDAVLGERVRDRGARFRIHIRELDWDGFHRFLPIGDGYGPLNALVRFVQRDHLDYDIRLHLLREEIKPLHIGALTACRLGWTSWLGHEHADGVITLDSAFIKDGHS